MADLAFTSTTQDWRRGSRPIGLAFAHRRAAGVLLLALFGYGAAMMLASGVPLAQLGKVVGTYLPLAAGAYAIVALSYVLSLLLSPGNRTDFASRFVWLTVAALMVCLTYPFFGMFKQIILPTRGFVWDMAFADTGRALFGVSPWRITHGWFGTLDQTRFLDTMYSLWLPIMFFVPLVAAVVCTNAILRFRILSSWFLAWVLIGSLAAWMFPSAGPCYFNALVGPDADYAVLEHRLTLLRKAAEAGGYPIAALEFQPILLHSYRVGNFGFTGGISAMPSMHVALAFFLAILGWKRNWAWGLLASAYLLLIWIGSIHFGWHYFVDGPAAAVLMMAIWKLSKPIAKALYSDMCAQDFAFELASAPKRVSVPNAAPTAQGSANACNDRNASWSNSAQNPDDIAASPHCPTPARTRALSGAR